jgi:syntaxin 18
MVEHMNSLVDEVKQIEGKVLAISKLQETFTQNVLEQVNANYGIYIMLYPYY